jgi:hypothetical protein
LIVAGVAAITHDSVFAQDTPDEEWLTRAGREGWVVLTKDKLIRNGRSRSGPRFAAQLFGANVSMRRQSRKNADLTVYLSKDDKGGSDAN